MRVYLSGPQGSWRPEMEGHHLLVSYAEPRQIKLLDAGSHEKFSDGLCVMEAVAYVAREPFSDHPECACPVIGAFMRSWNDGLPADERQTLLLPLIPRLINTRGSKRAPRPDGGGLAGPDPHARMATSGRPDRAG